MTLEINIGHGLNLERAEASVASLAEGRGRVPAVVNLRECQHVDVRSAWLLGNAMAHYRKSHNLSVWVPEPRKFSGKWFLHFTRTGLGHAIAKHAEVVLSPTGEITDEMRSYYGRKGQWQSQNFGLVDDLHRGSLDPDDEPRFATVLEGFFSKAGYTISLRDSERQLTPFGRFLFESVQNVYDHATRLPMQLDPQTVLSYVSVTRHAELERPKSAGDPFIHYPERVAASGEFNGFVVVTVCDDGNGIAARHSLDNLTCQGDFETEQRVVVDALLPGHSVKLRANDCEVRGDPGFGLTRIGSALEALNAYATLRSGRILVTFDATAGATFRVRPEACAELPGTTIQVVFPNTQAIQRQMTLPLA